MEVVGPFGSRCQKQDEAPMVNQNKQVDTMHEAGSEEHIQKCEARSKQQRYSIRNPLNLCFEIDARNLGLCLRIARKCGKVIKVRNNNKIPMVSVRGEVMPLEIVVFYMHKVLHIYRQQEEGKTLYHRVWTGGKASRGGGAPGGPKGGAARF
jgi:hypothetical protein